MSAAQTYILHCNGCTGRFVPSNAENGTVPPRTLSAVRAQAAEHGWSTDFHVPVGKGLGWSEDFCRCCSIARARVA